MRRGFYLGRRRGATPSRIVEGMVELWRAARRGFELDSGAMTRLAPALLGLLALSLPPPAWAQTLELRVHGKPIATRSLAELQKLVPVEEIAVLEPHEARVRRYVGFPVGRLFEALFGAEWARAEDVFFAC